MDGARLPAGALGIAARTIAATRQDSVLHIETSLGLIRATEPWSVGAARRIGQRIAAEGGHVKPMWTVVVKDEATDADCLAQVAERAIDRCRPILRPGVVTVEDLAVVDAILLDRERATTLARLLDPIARHDARANTEILATLQGFILSRDVSIAAREMGIDRHTVLRRLRRAEDLLGRSVRWGWDRITIEHAILARASLSGSRLDGPRPVLARDPRSRRGP